MMSIDTAARFTLERIRDHPWFTRYHRNHHSPKIECRAHARQQTKPLHGPQRPMYGRRRPGGQNYGKPPHRFRQTAAIFRHRYYYWQRPTRRRRWKTLIHSARDSGHRYAFRVGTAPPALCVAAHRDPPRIRLSNALGQCGRRPYYEPVCAPPPPLPIIGIFLSVRPCLLSPSQC